MNPEHSTNIVPPQAIYTIFNSTGSSGTTSRPYLQRHEQGTPATQPVMHLSRSFRLDLYYLSSIPVLTLRLYSEAMHT